MTLQRGTDGKLVQPEVRAPIANDIKRWLILQNGDYDRMVKVLKADGVSLTARKGKAPASGNGGYSRVEVEVEELIHLFLAAGIAHEEARQFPRASAPKVEVKAPEKVGAKV